jgi:cytochrome c556
MSRSLIISSVLAVAVVALQTNAYADDKDVIEYREHIMNTLNEQAGALGQILSTAVPADNAAAHLDILALTAATALKAFEPRVPGGEAKPEVWSDWADFSRRMNEFARNTSEAAKIAKERGTDAALANILDQLTCKACHKVYREEKKDEKKK